MDTVPWIASGSKAAVEEFENGLPEVTVLLVITAVIQPLV